MDEWNKGRKLNICYLNRKHEKYIITELVKIRNVTEW